MFSIKRISKGISNFKSALYSSKKRALMSESVLSPTRRNEEIQDFKNIKAFKITKNTEKRVESASNERPDYEIDIEKNARETSSKLAKDVVQSPSITVKDKCLKIFQTHKSLKNKEEKKSSDPKK